MREYRLVALFGLFALALLIAAACPAASESPAWPELALTPVLAGLTNPVHVASAGDGSGRLFVVEQPGVIRVVRGGVLLSEPFLDITDRVGSRGSERGLLSVAFPPGYGEAGHFYVNYTDSAGDTVVSRFGLSSDPDQADPTSEQVLLTVDQPFANHNGGQLAFGPDGYLYIGMGDGGSRGDPGNRAQDPGDLLGKLLRIDVESGAVPYAIPIDNPFVEATDTRPEIWALGLRNPWRFSFDRQTGDLYIGDVGQNDYEEVNLQLAGSDGGENYGWRILEATHCYEPPAGCVPPEGYVGPVVELAHVDKYNSVTGGFVYRGVAFPNMRGVYIFADYSSGRLLGLRQVGQAWELKMLLDTAHLWSSFGEDEDGELFIASLNEGTIYHIEDRSPALPTPTVVLRLRLPLLLKILRGSARAFGALR